MANIAVLVPRLDMMEQAQSVAAKMNMVLHQNRVIETPGAVQAARDAVAAGAQIVVARGLQGELIKRSTNVPLVEIRLTGQELGLLMLKAKKLCSKKKPHIAVVGFTNTYSSMRHFEKLFNIRLSTYFVSEMDELQSAVEQAVKAGADVIIGGDHTKEASEHLGVPALFNEATDESIREALLIAQKAAYALDVESQALSQLDSIFETTLNGIIRLDLESRITAANQVVRDVLNIPDGVLIGAQISDFISAVDAEFVLNIINGTEQRVTTSAVIGNSQLMLTAAPIEASGHITGCILTLHHLGSVMPKSESKLHDMFLNGFVASGNFSQITRSSKSINHCIERAKMYALSRSPVVIYGEAGTEKELFAQAIHNNSARRNQPYLSVSCYEASDEKQAALLFGLDDGSGTKQDGALLAANFGTLHITDIHNLTPQCQFRLLKLINQRVLIRNDISKAMSLDVRILVSSDQDLVVAVEQGNFRKDLYYQLQALVLTLPPLRESPDEIHRLAEKYIKQYMKRYGKYIVLTGEAMQKLAEYHWAGNMVQLEQFCELLVLTAKKCTLDEGYVFNLLADTYPVILQGQEGTQVTVYKHPEALKIAQLLEDYSGNRTEVARKLGISTTTLWRRIKKYGVEEKYSP